MAKLFINWNLSEVDSNSNKSQATNFFEHGTLHVPKTRERAVDITRARFNSTFLTRHTRKSKSPHLTPLGTSESLDPGIHTVSLYLSLFPCVHQKPIQPCMHETSFAGNVALEASLPVHDRVHAAERKRELRVPRGRDAKPLAGLVELSEKMIVYDRRIRAVINEGNFADGYADVGFEQDKVCST